MTDDAGCSRRTTARSIAKYCLIGLVVAPPALMALTYLVFCTWIVVSGGITFVRNHISGKPLQFERALFLASPDRKTEFIAERDGTLQFVDITTGRILQSQNYSPEDYASVEAKWTDSKHLSLFLPYRQPLLANGFTCTCSVQKGFVTRE